MHQQVWTQEMVDTQLLTKAPTNYSFRDANQVHHWLATGVLEKLMPSTVPDSELSAQIGDDLALLIAEAEKASCDGDIQRIVVRSSPVHLLHSLMENEAESTAHDAVLSSWQLSAR